jgi:putative RNA 2'-phosphotransferase
MNGHKKNSGTNGGKFLSFVLRHGPEKIGLQLDTDGWANINDLIAGKLEQILINSNFKALKFYLKFFLLTKFLHFFYKINRKFFLQISGAAKNGRHYTRDSIRQIVLNNDKKRFALSEDGQRIRAVQGHSSDQVLLFFFALKTYKMNNIKFQLVSGLEHVVCWFYMNIF